MCRADRRAGTIKKLGFLGAHDVYRRNDIVHMDSFFLTSGEPLGLARAARDQHGSEGARSPGQNYLVGHALIRA